MEFGAFLGNPAVKESLSALAEGGKFPHAVILEGPPGSGKRMLAGILAQYLVCRGEEKRPCGECIPCRKAARGVHPDISVVSGGGGSRSFHVEDIRRVIGGAYILPNEAERKVFLLEEAQNMSVQAQNALLKVLEEPPAYVVFILTCEAASQLLYTIQSRAAVFTLGEISEDDAVKAVKRALPDTPEEEIRAAARIFGGCVGKIMEACRDESLQAASERASRLGEAVLSRREYRILAALGPFEKDKNLLRDSLQILSHRLREANVLCAGAAGHRADGLCRRLGTELTQEQILGLIGALEDAAAGIDRNANQTLLLSLLCRKLYRAAVLK